MHLLLKMIGLLAIVGSSTEGLDIIDTYHLDDVSYSYGSCYNDDRDGVLIANDLLNNEVIYTLVYDKEYDEYFKYVAKVSENEYVIVCERYDGEMSEHGENFIDTILIKIDGLGNILEERSIEIKFIDYYNHNYRLIGKTVSNSYYYYDCNLQDVSNTDIENEYTQDFFLQYRGVACVNGVLIDRIFLDQIGMYRVEIAEKGEVFIYDIVIKPEIFYIGDFQGASYVGPVKIVCSNEVFINDDLYPVGSTIETPGIYNVRIHGVNEYSYLDTFIIDPIVSYSTTIGQADFVNGLVVYEPISIYSNAISLFLDGSMYESGMIEEVGKYDLTVYGVNGLTYDLEFSICPKVYGLDNFGEYDRINFSVFGHALLNGENVEGSILVQDPGNYILELLLEDEVYQKYYFKILEGKVTNDIDTTFNYNYVIGGVIVFGAALFFLKK